ncbi:PPC domain-containing protein [Anatilimnocola floriformis]|uniref:PPC domain-containing protein n=1 Tax=Anatilimnocola floriformis TaxID=2948575 RepID=UPI0020C4F80F|nr:PPC domain-containing protein [Anatilimnocola floriformis]
MPDLPPPKVTAMHLRLFIFTLLAVALASTAQAEPFIEHLEPPALTRGQANKLTIVGSELDRAQQLWFSLPEKFFQIKVQSSALARAEVEVNVAADCPLGIYGLRLATEDGLSNLQLFAVDELPPTKATNEPLQKLPVAIAGDLQAAEVDRIRFTAAAGEQISFDIVCSRFGSDADPLLTIVDEHGKRIVQKDNSPGIFYDCVFSHTFKTAGTYTLEVRDSRYLGSPHWQYWLRIGKFAAARVSLPSTILPGVATKIALPEINGEVEVTTAADQPLGNFFPAVKRKDDSVATWLPLTVSAIAAIVESEPNDTRDSPTHVATIPASLQGVLNPAGDVDCFTLYLTKGQKLSLRAETKTIQSAADLEVILLDRTGREMQRMDDVTLPGGALEEAAFNFNVGDDGLYYIQVRDLSGSGSPAHAYRIDIAPQQPKLELKSEISALSVPLCSYQRLPFAVTRTECPGLIELSLVNAPAGVTLEPTTIPEGVNSLDCKLRAANNSPLGLSSIQVLAKTKVGEQEITAALTVQPLVDRQLINVDLIKHALRENQRWLPATCTRSIALQITPAVPFTVELAAPELVLPRYQQATATIVTTRDNGFAEPISFTAIGGQCGEEKQGRKQVFARIANATKEEASVPALFISRSLANDASERIDVTAVAKQGPRTVTLQRSLQLIVKPGFEVTIDPPPPTTLPPGSNFNLRLALQRLPSFAGPVEIEVQPISGLQLPEKLTIAAEANSTEFAVTIPDDFRQGRHRFRFTATGQVGNFQEEPRPKEFDLEVKAPPMEKKK